AIENEKPRSGRLRAFEEIEKERFVIALEGDHPVVARQIQNDVHHLARVGPAIDVIAEKDDRVVAIELHLAKKGFELAGATMDVADGEDPRLGGGRHGLHSTSKDPGPQERVDSAEK